MNLPTDAVGSLGRHKMFKSWKGFFLEMSC